MDKPDLEARLLALGRNAGVRARGIRRRAIDMTLAGEPVRVEASYVHLAPERAAGRGTRADGPPVVLVHGTPGSLFSWGRVALGGPGFEGLAARSEVYLLDVIGHGVTRTSSPPYGFQRCADFVAGFLAGMGLEDVLLAGHSYGGEFAWRVAVDRPDLVASLVLVASSGYPRPREAPGGEPEGMRTVPGAGFSHLLRSRERVRSALQTHFPVPVADDLVSEIYYLCENSENFQAMIDLARDENGGRSHELRALAQPTLLLWGDDDRAFPAEASAERFLLDIPEAQLARLGACGHHALETRPDEVARRIQEFIDKTWR